jgi:hypothetical protein
MKHGKPPKENTKLTLAGLPMLRLAGYKRRPPQDGLFGEDQFALARAAQAVSLTFMGYLDFTPLAQQGRAVERVRCGHRSRRPVGRRC